MGRVSANVMSGSLARPPMTFLAGAGC
jgi:hypothetical protein